MIHQDRLNENPIRVSIVVPVFCEEEVLPQSISVLSAVLHRCIEDNLATTDSELVLVDDGSVDRTWAIIVEAHAVSPHTVRGVRLSANSGHQNALIAGLEAARGDFVISIDADLQDDAAVIRDMILEARAGIDIVYGVRKSRPTDTFFKRVTAEGFYKFMAVLGVDLVFNHADFRGMSRRAVDALLRYRERSLFLRGLVRQLGFKTCTVYYDRSERKAGVSKYPLGRMLAFAVHGITSFSFVPLRMVTLLSLVLFSLSIGLILWILFVRYFTDSAVPGWASTLFIQSMFGGIQLLCLGVIGEYLAVIFTEVKNRPRFNVQETTDPAPGRESHTRNCQPLRRSSDTSITTLR